MTGGSVRLPCESRGMGRGMNYAIPRGTTPRGVPASPRSAAVYCDERPLGRLPYWKPRTERQRAKDEQWRQQHAAEVKPSLPRQAGNVIEW